MTYERNHVHHRGIARHQKQERDLNGVGLLDVARSQLLDNELADEVVLGVRGELVDEVSEVAEQFPGARVNKLME